MSPRPTLSVAIITKNEEANIRRTLESVKWADEIVVVDSGSTDRTCDIAREFGAKVFVEEWKGFAKQKNSAIDKCTSHWILSLDADEEVSPDLKAEMTHLLDVEPELRKRLRHLPAGEPGLFDDSLDTIEHVMAYEEQFDIEIGDGLFGFSIPRRNHFLGRWIKHGGFYPDRKPRLIRSGYGGFEVRAVHESMVLKGKAGKMNAHLIHHAYPTLSGYIEHMNRYSDLGAEMAVEKGKRGFSVINIVVRPIATFLYNYFFRLGFLDGREGLLLHLYHSVYVSWKYAKVWELTRQKRDL